jgi:superkiller protein 3
MRQESPSAVTETADRLQKTLDQEPTALAFVALAHMRLESGDADEAIRLCERGLAGHPNHSTGHLVYGLALKNAGREEEAVTEFREVVNLDPGNRIAIQQLGEAYRRSAGAAGARVRPATPDEPEEEPKVGDEIAFFTNSMAEVYESQGFFEKALTIYHRLLTLQPHRDDVREKIRNLEHKMGVA